MTTAAEYHAHSFTARKIHRAVNVGAFARLTVQDNALGDAFRRAIQNLQIASTRDTLSSFITFIDRAAKYLEHVWVQGYRQNCSHWFGARAKEIRRFNHELFDIIRNKSKIDEERMKLLQNVIAETAAEYSLMPQAKARTKRKRKDEYAED